MAERKRRRRYILLGLFVVLVVVAVVAYRSAVAPPSIPSRCVIEVTVAGSLDERPEAAPLGGFFGTEPLGMLGLWDVLRKARVDPRVVGVLLVIRDPAIGLGKIEELRSQVRRLRESGKRVLAYGDVLSNKEYYLASAADAVYLDAAGDLTLVGLSTQVLFIRQTLSKLGLEADLERVGDFKGTFETFRLDGPSDPLKTSLGELFESCERRFIQEIAGARSIDPDELRKVIDGGPFSPEGARAARLIDGTCSPGELDDLIAEEFGSVTERVVAEVYRQVPAESVGIRSGSEVAYIPIQGVIAAGGRSSIPWIGGMVGVDGIRHALRRARTDPAIRAAILRVDSGGGTVIASEQIWREVKALNAEKPVVVSFSDIAASGAYYLAAPADRIIAYPTTLTGSIGVFGGKVVAKELYDAIGVNRHTIKRSARADMYSEWRPFNEDERAVIRGRLEEVYKEFVTRVAEGRKKSFDGIERVAQGRVWSGEDALKVGLVSRLGGIDEAVDEIRERLGESVPPRLRVLPEERGWLEHLLGSKEPEPLTRVLGKETPIVRAAEALAPMWLLDGRGALALLPFAVQVE